MTTPPVVPSDIDMNTAVVDFGSDCCFAQDSLSFTNTKVFRGTSLLVFRNFVGS